MANIAQSAGPQKGFNLQINIDPSLKREVNTVAAELDCYPRDIVNECLRIGLPVKRQEAKRLREAESNQGPAKKK